MCIHPQILKNLAVSDFWIDHHTPNRIPSSPAQEAIARNFSTELGSSTSEKNYWRAWIRKIWIPAPVRAPHPASRTLEPAAERNCFEKIPNRPTRQSRSILTVVIPSPSSIYKIKTSDRILFLSLLPHLKIFRSFSLSSLKKESGDGFPSSTLLWVGMQASHL